MHLAKHAFPGGYVGSLEIIKHPGAALILPFLGRDKIVFIRQYRPVIGGYIWELPAGTRKQKESLLACARRELQEETGYCASRMAKVGHIYPAPGYTTEKIAIYKAEGLRLSKAVQEKDEDIPTRVLDRLRVRQMVRKGRIVDAKTICALALAHVI